ncbi:uncharacterized protein LOC129237730 [Anastrepha obliqua]|uniref:uncharacterized protein LOC129237730 n=1 Tax=Anastrepha obliqua TaxID=95512 RepID=UPI00240A864F|nr:uncharacterized protein LOC129237730 [Anastrepha obliqua]
MESTTVEPINYYDLAEDQTNDDELKSYLNGKRFNKKHPDYNCATCVTVVGKQLKLANDLREARGRMRRLSRTQHATCCLMWKTSNLPKMCKKSCMHWIVAKFMITTATSTTASANSHPRPPRHI